MIDKAIAVYFLAYNLVRWAMAKAALLADVLPQVLSFTKAKRLLSAFADQLRRTSCAPWLRLLRPASLPCDCRIDLIGSNLAKRSDDRKTSRY